MSMSNRIVIIHRKDEQNAGDMASCPKPYFKWLADAKVVDICAEGASSLTYPLAGADVILGGGGLFYEPFDPMLRYIINSRTKSLTLWGIGRNYHMTDNPSDDHLSLTAQELIEKADLVGLRDCRIDPKWVPCPSVHHLLFAGNNGRDGWTPTEKVLAVQHREERFRFKVPSSVREVRSQGSMWDLLGEIDKAELVLSSSYHGCLWSAMFGRKTVAIDGHSPKFRTGLPESVVQMSESQLAQTDLTSLSDSIKPDPKFLSMAQSRSYSFASKVAELIGGLPDFRP